MGKHAHLTLTLDKISSPSPFSLFLKSFPFFTKNPFTWGKGCSKHFVKSQRKINERPVINVNLQLEDVSRTDREIRFLFLPPMYFVFVGLLQKFFFILISNLGG